jgi:hypothetical protein
LQVCAPRGQGGNRWRWALPSFTELMANQRTDRVLFLSLHRSRIGRIVFQALRISELSTRLLFWSIKPAQFAGKGSNELFAVELERWQISFCFGE